MTTPSIGVNQIESEAGSRQPRHLSSTCCPNKGLCGVHRGSYPPTPLTATEAIAYVECVVCGEMLRTLDNCPHCGRSLYIDIEGGPRIMDAIVMKEPPTVQRWAELMENFPSDGWEGAAAAIADHDKQVVEYEHALDAHDPSWRAKPLQFTPRSKLDPSAIVVVGDTCVQAAWGALSVSEGQIYGLMSLWLPNVSMSLSMAEDLHRHLGVAIELAKKQVSDAAAN